MIKSIHFKSSPKRHHFSYVSELDSVVVLGGKIEFTDGLNIIVGPNGSGKSSILNIISHQLAANITGVSAVSKSWLTSVQFDDSKPLGCADIEHDGRPVFYCSPRQGISALVGQLDESEFALNVALDVFDGSKESTGEKNNRLMMPFMESVINSTDHPESIGMLFSPNSINDYWKGNLMAVHEEWLKPSIPLGKPTLILDEPETGLGILNQILLWKKVLSNPDILSRYQIILVSHSHESIQVPDAHYIELKKGYLDTCRRALNGDFSEEEIKKQASKLSIPLTKIQHKTLIAINNAPSGSYKYTESQTQEFLLEKGFIDVFEIKEKTESESGSIRDRVRRNSSFNRTYCCVLTSLGKQYINLHS